MKRAWLHEAAKFGAGLITADFLMLWWLSGQKFTSVSFLGFTITKGMVGPAMFIDVFFLLLLIHYAWHVGKIPRVKERLYYIVAGAAFTLILLGHLAHVLSGSDLVIFSWDVPVFVSWIGAIVTLYLAFASFQLASRRK